MDILDRNKEEILLEQKPLKEERFEDTLVYERAFELAHTHVESIEGGLAEHKDDPGGITKYGISLRFLEDYEKTKQGRKLLTKLKIYTVDRNSILEMRKNQAKAIYYNAFWLSPKINLLPLYLAIITYDYAVNSGSFYAVKVLQKALGITIDGIIGPQTEEKAAMAVQKDIAKLMLEERVKFYRKLVQQKPKMKTFLRGWLNRVESLTKYLNTL